MDATILKRRGIARYWQAVCTAAGVLVVAMVLFVPGAFAQDAYYDDFSQSTSGWLVYEDTYARYQYTGGEYVVAMKQPNVARWSWAPTTAVPSSFLLEVTARASGAGGMYGLVWGQDDNNLTALWVSPDGWYAVYPYSAGRWSQALVTPSRHSSIRTGSSSNHFEVTVDGPTVRIAVNGASLTTLSHTSGTISRVGVIVSSGTGSAFKAVFDGFRFASPSTSAATGLILLDRFTSAQSGWEAQQYSDASVGYAGVEYAIAIRSSDRVRWSWAPTPSAYENAILETAAYRHIGDNAVRYGLVWGLDNENFYLFEVTPAGEYVVDLMRNGVWLTPPVGFSASTAIRTQDLYNKLQVEIADGQATVAVNGTDLASFRLALAGPYQFGVVANSGTSVPVEVRFIDFVVRQAD